MMAVLFMVGDGIEAPSIAAQLLDLNTYPSKPHFASAEDAPLVLHDCIYDRLDFQWQPENLWRVQVKAQQSSGTCIKYCYTIYWLFGC